MKFNFGVIDFTLVNGINGDPALYMFIPKSGEAILFDIGDISCLSNKDILRIKHVLVSHTHIDHFIGFDWLLRLNIPHNKTIYLCGPDGFIDNIKGKLNGYTWNLIHDKNLKFIVNEVCVSGDKKTVLLMSANYFEPISVMNAEDMCLYKNRLLIAKPAVFVSALSDGSIIEAISLDHGDIRSLAYVYQSAIRFKIKEDVLNDLKLSPGPWIRDLQYYVQQEEYNKTILIDGKVYSVESLSRELFHIDSPKIIGYLTDFYFCEDNIKRIFHLFENVEIMVCEASFKDCDKDKAYFKKHLTTKQAALLAAYVRANDLKVFHISNSYSQSFDKVYDEAYNFFIQYKKLSIDEIYKLIMQELNY